MIEDILPGQVVAEEACSDLPSGPGLGLFPEEAALVADAVPHRRQEFATVRACARRALGRLGQPPVPLLWGHRGAPVWPDGIVGSMTHCKGFRGAAVARSDEIASVGIDAEPDLPLPAGVLDAIALRIEVGWLAGLSARYPGVCWDRLLFSAKESVYKTVFPLDGQRLDFDEAEIRIDPVTGTFAVRLLVPGPTVDGRPVHTLTGRWVARRGLLVTGIALPRVSAPHTPTVGTGPHGEAVAA